MRPLSWIVGLDTTERCVGALRWVAWLKARARRPGTALVGVHVVEPARLAFAPGGEGDDRTLVEALRAFVDRLGLSEVLDSIDVVRAASAAEGLTSLASRTGAGLVVGRAARSHGWSLTALGGTARRVLRELPGPVCVVPPDFDIGPADAGPIALALDADDTCVDAVRLATQFGRGVSIAVMGVHVLAPIDPMTLRPESAGAYEPFPTTDRDYVRLEHAARDRFEEFFRKHDLEAVDLRLEHGTPAKVIEDVAAREHASLIACGSRRLGLASRLFTTSVGTDLAAHASRPVMIVPPG
jgi:nucleotide-binding universal stress UspA family protein